MDQFNFNESRRTLIMKGIILALLLALVCSFASAQNLPLFQTPDDAKAWVYTVKPTQLLDYLVWASKVENEKPVITWPTVNYLLLNDQSLYVSYSKPLTVSLGKGLIDITANPEVYTIKDFAPKPVDLTWNTGVLVGGVSFGVGFLVGVLVRGFFK